MAKILIVDDDEHICEALRQFLAAEGHTPIIASSAESALEKFAGEQPELVLMDVRMPGEDGLQALRRIRDMDPGAYVVIMTAYGTSQTSIEAMQLGAFEYIAKPLDLDVIKPLVERAITAHAAGESAETEAPKDRDKDEQAVLVGNGPTMQEAFKLMGLLASNDAPVLLIGERGVGKEVVARTIHSNSSRRHGTFTTVHCRTLPEGYLGVELFGEETGENGRGGRVLARGRLETSRGGTLFLDDVDALSLPLQSRLLRYLQEQRFERIGGTTPQEGNTRIIATTGRNLGQLVQQGDFNEELFGHLRALAIRLPALRERREDIADLTSHFIRRFNAELQRRVKRVDDEVAALFQQYSWPGNVEELKQVLQRACLLAPGELITRQELGEGLQGGAYARAEETATELEAAIRRAFHERLTQPKSDGEESPYHQIVNLVESTMVKEALEMTSGNQLRASEMLGVNRTTLRKKMGL